MNQKNELKLQRLIHLKTNQDMEKLDDFNKNMIELKRLKKILSHLGYLDVYLNMYLKNTNKKDNLKNIQQYIHQNLDVWLRDGHRL
tara:strand:- start:350 stop:607 length:258 start_codon:yes stop_codon:yes gene_type:complete